MGQLGFDPTRVVKCFECGRLVAAVNATTREADKASLCQPCARRELK